MSRIILLAPLCVLLMIGPALGDAVVGSTPPGGWGTDCSNWIQYSDAWSSGQLCYNPNMGGGGDGWVVCGTYEQLVWPDLNVELWIEMECTFYWDATHVQIHRYADYSDIEFYLCGGSSCNNGQYIITTPSPLQGTLDYLYFQEDMFGRTGSTYGTDIPLLWEVSLNGGDYELMADLNPEDLLEGKYFLVPLCDNDWCVRVTGDVNYHQEDGYYFLGGPGAFTCPADPM